MPNMERVREVVHGKLDLDDMLRKYAAGWRLAALEWERESGEGAPPPVRGNVHELPYGLRVAADCKHLEEDPEEMKALKAMMELIVQDISMQRIAIRTQPSRFSDPRRQPVDRCGYLSDIPAPDRSDSTNLQT